MVAYLVSKLQSSNHQTNDSSCDKSAAQAAAGFVLSPLPFTKKGNGMASLCNRQLLPVIWSLLPDDDIAAVSDPTAVSRYRGAVGLTSMAQKLALHQVMLDLQHVSISQSTVVSLIVVVNYQQLRYLHY